MKCKVRSAARYRKEVPAYTDAEVKNHLIDVMVKRTASHDAYNTPEWKVYRGLVRREAARRGITL